MNWDMIIMVMQETKTKTKSKEEFSRLTEREEKQARYAWWSSSTVDPEPEIMFSLIEDGKAKREPLKILRDLEEKQKRKKQRK